ncbi:hypothetical protein P692DRAFT_20827720 [Suillus brevipes Sb2]|nr:hypothetical protein P692DRAFT_20827720 [Suillus brevipes Sb2]
MACSPAKIGFVMILITLSVSCGPRASAEKRSVRNLRHWPGCTSDHHEPLGLG